MDVSDCFVSASVGAYIVGSSFSKTLSDCEITGDDACVRATDGLIEIEGGTISGQEGIRAEEGEAKIDSCSVTGPSSFGIYASGGSTSVSATSCTIKSSSSDKESCAGVYSASSASITVSGGSIEGPVGAWAYSGNVTIKDSASVTSTAGDGVKAYQGTMDVTGAEIESADSGAYCTSTGTVKLTSCSITGATYATYQSGGTLTVSGGSLTGPNGCYCSGGTTNLQSSCSVTATGASGYTMRANGGTINATGCALKGYYGAEAWSGTVNLSGCDITENITIGAWADGGTINVQSSTSISASSYGVYSTSGTVAISGSSSVTSTGSYGAYVNGGKVTVSDSTTSIQGTSYGVYVNSGSFKSETDKTGGTIKGNCGIYNKGTVDVNSVTITGSSSYGIDIHVSSAVTTLTSCTVSGSSHGIYGYYPGTLTISGGSVTGASGSGVYCYDSGTVNISSSASISSTGSSTSHAGLYMTNYSGLNVTAENSTIKGYYYAVYQVNGTLEMTSCTTSTSSTGSSAYGVYVTGGTSTTISGGSISGGNGAYVSGGKVELKDSCSVTATNTSSGSAVVEAGGTITLTSCTLKGYNGIKCTSGEITATSSCLFDSCTYGAYAEGGTINLTGASIGTSVSYGAYATGGTINLNSSTSISVSTSNTGSVSTYYSAVWEDGGTINLNSCTLSGYCGIKCSSGSISATSSCTIKSCTYGVCATGGTITLTGVAMSTSISYGAYATGGKIELKSSCSISVSTSNTGSVSTYYSAVWADGGTMTLTSCTLSGYCGVKCSSGSIAVPTSCTIKSCTYGVCVTGGTVDMSGYTLNSSISYGAYVTGGELDIDSCTVSATYHGVYATGGTVKITAESSIASTSSSTSYAGIYMATGSPKVTVLNSTVTGVYRGVYQTAGTLEMTSCEISATNTGSSAYAVYVDGSGATSTMTSCTLNGYYGARAENGAITLSDCTTDKTETTTTTTTTTVHEGYTHKIAVTPSGITGYSTAAIEISYVSQSSTKVTSVSTLISDLYGVYGTGSFSCSLIFMVDGTLFDMISLSTAHCASSSEVVFGSGSLTVAMTSSEVTITGSAYTNGTYSYTASVSDAVTEKTSTKTETTTTTTVSDGVTIGAYAEGNGVDPAGCYTHTVTVTVSGMSAYSSAMIMVAYTSTSSTKVTSMSTLIENLYDCYGASSIGDASLMFMANGGYIIASSARCSSSSELVFTGTSDETITITSSQVTVSGSVYTNDTFSCSYSVSDDAAMSADFSGGTIVIQSGTKISAASYGVQLEGGYIEISGSSTSVGASSYGLYVASGTLAMSGGTASGTRALQMIDGTAKITAGTLTSTSSYTVYQEGGKLNCTASFSTAKSHQIYENGGTATFTNCSVNGGSSYRALYLYSGYVYLSGGTYQSSSSYTIYVYGGTLSTDATVYNSSSSSSTYAIYNYNGTVSAGGTVYHSGYGIAFYNRGGEFYLTGGAYYGSRTHAIYIAGGTGQIGANYSSTNKSTGCHIYRSYNSSSYADSVVCISGGTVDIYGCYIESKYYGSALELTGSPTVRLGYSYSGSSNSRTDAFTPMIEAEKSGQYPIYVNMSGGVLESHEADIYGVDYGIYIADGPVWLIYVWITVEESSAYEIYVVSATASYFSLNVSNGNFYGPENAKNVYLIYVYSRSSFYSPEYSESRLTYNDVAYTSLSGNYKPNMRV